MKDEQVEANRMSLKYSLGLSLTLMENLKINQEKNTAAMKWICHENQVPYYKFSLSEIRIKNYDMIGQSDCSRCGHHAGPKFHTAAADYIADHINL